MEQTINKQILQMLTGVEWQDRPDEGRVCVGQLRCPATARSMITGAVLLLLNKSPTQFFMDG